MFREWLNKNSGVVTVVAVVVLVLALGLVVWNMKGGRGPRVSGKDYYYDLNTKKLIVDKSGQHPPFQVSTGSQPAVGVVVYACGEGACGTESQRKIGFLWRYTTKGLALAQEVAKLPATPENADRRGELSMQMEQEKEYRMVDSDKWLAASDPQAQGMLGSLYGNCPGSKKLEVCVP